MAIGALVCWRMHAPQVRVVAGGVDTLHLWSKWQIAPEWVLRLRELKAAAEEQKSSVAVEVAGVGLSCKPHGAGGAPFFLDSDLFAVRVSPNGLADSPRVVVELRALALWSMGWKQAAARAEDIMAEICGCEKDVRLLDTQVSRLDLALDFQGWELRPDDKEAFTCRIRRGNRGSHFGTEWLDGEATERESGRVVELAKQLQKAKSQTERAQLLRAIRQVSENENVSVWGDAKAFSGFTLGRGVVSARAYNKTRELGVSRKWWVRSVWEKCPAYAAERDVWRLEFQLRREGLTSFKEVIDMPGLDVSEVSLGSWRHVSARLDSLWWYLTTRWLRHGVRTALNRQAVSEVWGQVQRAWKSDAEPVQLHRPALDCARKSVVPALAGYLATASAQITELRHLSGGAPLPYWRTLLGAVRAAHAYAVDAEQPIPEKLAIRAERLAVRRRVTGQCVKSTVELEIGRSYAEHGKLTTGVRLGEGPGPVRGVNPLTGHGWVTHHPRTEPLRPREVGW